MGKTERIPIPTQTTRRGFTLPEILIIGAIIVILLLLFLPYLKRNRVVATESRKSGLAMMLSRVTRAKEL